jgi:hypothetical protein
LRQERSRAGTPHHGCRSCGFSRSINNTLVYSIALKDAGVSTELHLYAHGGNAFGLRRTKEPITKWPQLVEN